MWNPAITDYMSSNGCIQRGPNVYHHHQIQNGHSNTASFTQSYPPANGYHHPISYSSIDYFAPTINHSSSSLNHTTTSSPSERTDTPEIN